MNNEQILKEYNLWRRGYSGYEMPDPTLIGIAIDSVLSQLAALKEEDDRMKARVAELAAPAVQGEPVAVLLIDEPERTERGLELGDWDIAPNATAIEAFARLAGPGAYQLYLAPQPAEQKPAPDVAQLVGALERIKGMDSMSYHSLETAQLVAKLALGAYHKGGEV